MISAEYTITDLNQLIYNFAFDYLKKKYVKVSSKNTTTGVVTNCTYGVHYVVVDKTIELLQSVGAVGDVLRIVRETSTSEQIVSWNDASILKASDMSLAQIQQLHILEEYGEHISTSSLTLDVNGQYDAKNSRIVNLVAPQTATDAVNRGYIDSFIGTLTDAQSWAVGSISSRPEGSAKYWSEQSKNYAEDYNGFNQNVLLESTGYGIIRGGNVTVSNMTATVNELVAHMPDGKRYERAQTTITIQTADATNPRIDLIYLSSAGVVSYLAGVAEASPVMPSVPDGGLGLNSVSISNDGTVVLTDLRWFKARYQNLKSLSLLDFGIIGDGITDNTTAIQKAINYCISHKLSLFVPTGIYMINSTGLTVTGSIEIFGPQIERLRGEWHYTYSGHGTGNNAVFRFISQYTGATMVKGIGPSGEGFNIHDIMFDGADCTCTTGTGVTPGTYDDTITFTEANTIGVDVQSFEHASVNDCMFVRFSGVGLLTGLWQTHNQNDFANCNDSVIMGSTDSTLVDFYIHHSVNGIKIGTDAGVVAHMSRILNARIEWMTGYGIKINYASDIKITGIIDRCTFSGIYAPSTYGHYAIDIDCDVRRCGTYYRGASLATVGTNYDKASNIYIHGAQYASIRGEHILSNSKDDGSGAMAPVIGVYAVNTQYSSFNPVFVNDWSSCTQFLLSATGGLDYNNHNERVIINNADTGHFKFDKANNALILADKNPGGGNHGQPGFYQYYLEQGSPISIDLGPYIPQNKMVEIICHIQAYTNYESVIKLAVLKSYKSSTLTYTVATVYRLDTDNTVLAITATIDTTTGVMTIGNSAPGGVALYKCEISVPH